MLKNLWIVERNAPNGRWYALLGDDGEPLTWTREDAERQVMSLSEGDYGESFRASPCRYQNDWCP